MTRVVHLVSSLSTGGAEMALYKLLRATDQRVFPTEVVTLTEPGTIAERIKALGIPVHQLEMTRGVPNPLAVLRLHRLLRRFRPAVLQTWLYHSDLLGLLAGKLARVPVIAWNIRCSTTDARYTQGLTGMTVRLLARLSGMPAVVVSNSQAGIVVHRQLGYRPRRWEMIPNGFDLQRFAPDPTAYASVRDELGLAAGVPLVGLVARYDPLKDHATFVRAAHALADPRVHFLLAGSGIDAANGTLTSLIGQLGLTRQFHLLGERNDIPRLTAAFDVATCCSTGEGFPNIVGEAMAAGVPVVSTDVGDAALILGGTGVVVAPRDAAALAAGWRHLLSLPSGQRAALGAAARRRVADEYDAGAVAARYAALYRGLAPG